MQDGHAVTVESTITDKIFFPGAAMATQSLAGLIFVDPAELAVWHVPADGGAAVLLVLDADYAIGGSGATGAGTITPLAAWAALEQWRVARVTPIVQTAAFPMYQPLSSANIEQGLDQLTRVAQEHSRELAMTLSVPFGETGPTLPAIADRAEKALFFDGAGNVDPISIDDFAAPAAAQAGLAEGFASILRNYTLGIDFATPELGVDPVTGVVDTRSFDVVAGGRIKNYLNDGGTAVFRYELATVASTAEYFASKADLPANVADYGASPSATAAANVTAFQAALDTGRAVFIPGGTYNLSAKLTSTGKAVAIITDGAAVLQWVASSATQGLDFAFSNLTTQTLSIGDIELVTECEGGGSAIKAVWPVGASGFNQLWKLGKIRIRGADIIAQDGFWDYGIDTTNGWLGYCETLDFYGQASGVIPLSTAAWVARGSSTDSRVHIKARYAKAMLLIAGFSEGLDISGSFAVACDYAVDCTGTTGLNTPGFIWIGGHAACFKGGIRSVNILQGNVSNLLFYKRPDSAQNFVGFDFDSASSEWQIADCKVFSLGNPGGGTTTALKDAGVNNITSGLRAVGCNTDVNIVSGASGFRHTFSRSEGDRGLITQGDTDGQVICLPGGSLGGTTSYFDTLAANSATPSILGYRMWGSCGHFLTANTIATTITDFTGGFPGDEFIVQSNDANTTIQHSTGLQLAGAVNKVLAAGETIRLRRVSATAWKQI